MTVHTRSVFQTSYLEIGAFPAGVVGYHYILRPQVVLLLLGVACLQSPCACLLPGSCRRASAGSCCFVENKESGCERPLNLGRQKIDRGIIRRQRSHLAAPGCFGEYVETMKPDGVSTRVVGNNGGIAAL